MLVNQAKNLENLPYSSLTQLQQSISQTEQLLSQAQRVAYSVSSINQAFTQTYPQSYSGTTSFAQLFRRRAGPLAKFACRFSRRHARAGRRGAEP